MHAYSYRTPSKHIYIDTGSEGPSHDPYSYTEYTVQPRADDAPTVVLHMGLAFWYEVDGKRTNAYQRGADEGTLVQLFEQQLGCTLPALHKAVDRIRSRCRECGAQPGRVVSGHPGETFLLCANGHVMDADFDEGAVI
jgi:hypothetical protein